MVFGPYLLLTETLTHEFSCEYCETFKNSYFEEHLQTPASVFFISMKNDLLNAHRQCSTTYTRKKKFVQKGYKNKDFLIFTIFLSKN